MTQIKTYLSKPVVSLICLIIVGWAGVAAFLNFLGFDPFINDAFGYWSISQNLGSFDGYHPPGYPLLILASSSFITFVKPLHIMQGLNLMAWIGSAICVYQILRTLDLPRAWDGALLYAFFPLVGLTYTVYPIADHIGAFFLTLGVLAYLKNWRIILILALGYGLIVHKLLWPFIATVALVGILERKLSIWNILFLGGFILVYWFLGWRHYSDILWIFRDSSAHGFELHRQLPILDAVFGSLFTDRLVDRIQFFVVLPFFITALFLTLSGIWKKQPILLVFTLPILLYGTVFTQNYALTLVRYGIFLIIPLWFYVDTVFDQKETSLPRKKLFWSALFACAAFSQLLWGGYMALWVTGIFKII